MKKDSTSNMEGGEVKNGLFNGKKFGLVDSAVLRETKGFVGDFSALLPDSEAAARVSVSLAAVSEDLRAKGVRVGRRGRDFRDTSLELPVILGDDIGWVFVV